MKKHFIISVLVLIFTTSCDYFIKSNKNNIHVIESSSSDTTKTIHSLSSKIKHLQGCWVLTDYYDKILQDKTIAKYYAIPASAYAWGFYIENDSLYSSGTLYGYNLKLNEENDTLAVIKEYDDFIFRYDSISDKITSTGIKEDKKVTYRRATEIPLNEILQLPTNNGYHKKISMRQLFTDSIIAGKYQSTQTSQNLILNSDGTMSGYKNFNKYWIHDFFGTSHPTLPYDVIFLEDSISGDSQLYHWKFKGKVFTLTEMKTKTGGDSWFPEGKSLTFVKKN